MVHRELRVPTKTVSKRALKKVQSAQPVPIKASPPTQGTSRHVQKDNKRSSRHPIVTESFIPPSRQDLDRSVPATQFHLYLQLPLHIRRQIWQLTLPPKPVVIKPAPPPEVGLIPDKKYRKLRSFTLFSKLPKDIRIAIFELVLPQPKVHQPRLVTYSSGWRYNRWSRGVSDGKPSAWISEVDGTNPRLLEKKPTSWSDGHGGSGPPVLLFVNKESRAFTMARYEKTSLWERHRSWCAESWGWRRVWFSPRRDSFHFSGDEWSYLQQEAKYKIPSGKFPKHLVQNLKVAMVQRIPNRYPAEGEEPPTTEEMMEKAEKDNRRQLEDVSQLFKGVKGLKEISLVIDARYRYGEAKGDLDNDDRWIDPMKTTSYIDDYLDNGKEMYIDSVKAVAESVRSELVDRKLPDCKVELMVNNGRENLEVRLDYLHGQASILSTGW